MTSNDRPIVVLTPSAAQDGPTLDILRDLGAEARVVDDNRAELARFEAAGAVRMSEHFSNHRYLHRMSAVIDIALDE